MCPLVDVHLSLLFANSKCLTSGCVFKRDSPRIHIMHELMMPRREIYEFPFDWSVERSWRRRTRRKKCWGRGGEAIMSWARKRLSVVRRVNRRRWRARDKSPLHVASRTIAYDFDWLCIAAELFCSPSDGNRTKLPSLGGRFISQSLSEALGEWWRKESDNQMMELKPRIIRHHNLRWRVGSRERENLNQFITMTRL